MLRTNVERAYFAESELNAYVNEIFANKANKRTMNHSGLVYGSYARKPGSVTKLLFHCTTKSTCWSTWIRERDIVIRVTFYPIYHRNDSYVNLHYPKQIYASYIIDYNIFKFNNYSCIFDKYLFNRYLYFINEWLYDKLKTANCKVQIKKWKSITYAWEYLRK